MTPQELQNQIDKLKADLVALQQEFYRNNFSAHQDFNKYSNFTTRLKIPHYEQLPLTGEVGELIEKGGLLYICSSANTFTLV